MTNIRLTERDLNIFRYMASLRLLTMNQMATLFYDNHPLPGLELEKGKTALRVRVSKLMNAGYIRSAPLSFTKVAYVKGYFLGPNGIEVIKDMREYEDYSRPRWLERKHTTCLVHGPHHVIANNFLINLLMLAKHRDDFVIYEWLGDKDATFRFTWKGTRLTFDPDLYLVFGRVPKKMTPMFLEVDRNTTTTTVIGQKTYRLIQYCCSDEYMDLFGSRKIPRTCFIVPDKKRLSEISKVISKIIKTYNVSEFQFFLSTFEGTDVFSIDEGRITDKSLNGVWYNQKMERVESPFNEG